MHEKIKQNLKLIIYSFIPLIVVSVLVEFGFYVTTKDQYYKTKLWNAISYLSKSDEPKRDLSSWEDNALTIRSDELESKLVQLVFTDDYSLRPKKEDTPKLDLSDSKSTVITPADMKNKSQDLIYIVGCSSAYGYGVRYDSTFGYELERYSQGKAKVINAGQVGWSSIQLVPVVKRIVDSYKPKAIILFMSNNEWKNWAEQKPNVGVVAFWQLASMCARSYALSYILYHAIMNNSNREEKEAVNISQYQTHNFDCFKEYKYALTNPVTKYVQFDFNQWTLTKAKYISNYQHNLLTMVNYCKKYGVQVVLMTLPINYKLSPSWASPQPLYAAEKNKNIALSLEHKVDSLINKQLWVQADSIVDIAIATEPNIAVTHYMKGFILEKQGYSLAAESEYALSREYMVGDLGAVLSLNNCMKQVGRVTHTDVIDVKNIFDEYGQQRGLFYNETLIDDDCHPNALGHQIIAKALANYFFGK